MSGGSGGSASATGGLSLTAKGDLLTFNTSETRLPVSATNGQVLTTNSAVADGIEWATAASGGAKSFIIGGALPAADLATSIQYLPIASFSLSGTESDAQTYMPLAFTWSNLSISVQADSTNVDPTFKSRVDGSTGNQILTITGTGNFEDVSNSDSVAANSLVNLIYGGEPSSGEIRNSFYVTVCEI